MKLSIVVLVLFSIVLTACSTYAAVTPPTSSYDLSQASLVLTNVTLIDGTGAEPVRNARVVIGGERILAVGPASRVEMPQGVEVIDLTGATIMPGFINAHVHDAYDAGRLKAWAQAGVTTVRDEGIISGPDQLPKLIALRDQLKGTPMFTRLISAGYMLTVPGGYGTLEVSSAEDGRQQVTMELNMGADQIKVTMESGYSGVTNLPLFTDEQLKVIVVAAHERGKLVTAHITDAKYLPRLIEAGVDDLAHIPTGFISKAQYQALIKQNIYVVTTLTVFEAYGGIQPASSTLRKLVEAGVPVAMGNDYTLVPQNSFDHFELGMPMHELTRMSEAGMTPMQIIISATHNAAHVCGLENELGTLEVGKLADILIVSDDPLQDLTAFTHVIMVIHSGEIIRR